LLFGGEFDYALYIKNIKKTFTTLPSKQNTDIKKVNGKEESSKTE
jgi:hypothetical protein